MIVAPGSRYVVVARTLRSAIAGLGPKLLYSLAFYSLWLCASVGGARPANVIRICIANDGTKDQSQRKSVVTLVQASAAICKAK